MNSLFWFIVGAGCSLVAICIWLLVEDRPGVYTTYGTRGVIYPQVSSRSQSQIEEVETEQR